MENQNNIQDELRGLNSSLPVNNSLNSFSVPEGYFDGLAASILAKVKEQNLSVGDELQQVSPLLASLSKKVPYTIPNGYFEDNIATLSSFIAEEESPVLKGVGKELPYSAPQGYFDNLPQQVLAKVAEPKAKVVPLFARKWTRMAVAAAIVGVITLGGIRFLTGNTEDTSVAKTNQPVDTTQNLVARNRTSSVVQEIQKASTEELDRFISTVQLNPAKQRKTTEEPTQTEELKNLLRDVSKKEIDAFLEQIPTADEDLLVID